LWVYYPYKLSTGRITVVIVFAKEKHGKNSANLRAGEQGVSASSEA